VEISFSQIRFFNGTYYKQAYFYHKLQKALTVNLYFPSSWITYHTFLLRIFVVGTLRQKPSKLTRSELSLFILHAFKNHILYSFSFV